MKVSWSVSKCRVLKLWCLVSVLLITPPLVRAAQFGDFTYQQDGSGITITRYTGAGGAVNVPASISGVAVTTIGKGAFQGVTTVSQVTLPAGLTSIADQAFWYCTGLMTVTIPDSVTNIGEQAFANCSKITAVTFPDNITRIGYAAFYASGLTNVTIPDKVTFLDNQLFAECSALRHAVIGTGVTQVGSGVFANSGLTEIYFKGNAPTIGTATELRGLKIYYRPDTTGWTSTFGGGQTVPWDYISGDFAYRATGSTMMITRYNGSDRDVTIPDSINGSPVTSVGYQAFMSCNVTNVVIPPTVTGIADQAFMYCKLTAVTIPSTVTNIGSAAFKGSPLQTVALQPGVITLGTGAFAGCVYLKQATLPNTLTTIGDEAFSTCWGLQDINIPNSVTNIGNSAFYHCVALTSITVPDSVINLGNFAFQSCELLREATLPASLQEIPAGAFLRCYALTKAIIPNTVTNIGGGAFQSCRSLVDITIPASVVSIGNETYAWCSGLTQVAIPNGVTTIGRGAFASCSGLRNVTISRTVTSGGDAFGSCSSLTNIWVDPENPAYSSLDGILFNKDQTVLVQYAGTSNKTKYTIPNSVTTIGGSAFMSCKLISVVIPSSLTNIGYGAFAHCSKLRGLLFEGAAPPMVGNDVFFGITPPLPVVYHHLDATGWTSTFADAPTAVWDGSVGDLTYRLVDGTITIVGYTGSGGTVIIPNTIDGVAVTRIAENAFNTAITLNSITIPATVTDIGDSAWANCYWLKTVFFLGNAPANIALNAFTGASIATVYHKPGTIGWSSTLAGRPALPALETPQVRRQASNVVLTWQDGVLLETTNIVTGPWVTNSAHSPYTNSSEGPRKFYRLKAN